MSHNKQFTLYTNRSSPNGYKVVYLLAELGLTYELVYLDFAKQEHKAPAFLALNPNGRVPTIIDHANTDFVLSESNAILLYLVDKYDTEHRLSAFTPDQIASQNQYLFFQVSGQQPYFAQWFIFKYFHPEKVPSAVDRYFKETERVCGVLDSILSKREWLVGQRMAVADMSFIPWTELAFSTIFPPEYMARDKFPHVYRWHTAMMTRPAIKAAKDESSIEAAIQARTAAQK